MLADFNKGISEDQKIRNQRKKDFHFLNVDLEIKSSEDLQPLLDELTEDENTMILYHQGFENNTDHATLETMSPTEFDESSEDYDEDKTLIGSTDILINLFCNLIENLSVESRRVWDNCAEKQFDVGFASGNTEKVYHTEIRAETMKRCAAIGASVMITVYPFTNYTLRNPLKAK